MTKFIAHVKGSSEIQLVSEHLYSVANYSKNFANKVNLPNSGYLLGLLHDFGKYSEQFQSYIKSATDLINQDEDSYIDAGNMKGKIDHSTAGAQFVFNEMSKLGKKELGVLSGQILAICIASHHGGMIDSLDLDGNNIFKKRIDKDHELTNYEQCLLNAHQ